MPDLLAHTRTSCAHCEGVKLIWRVRRVRAAGSPLSQRTLVWMCRGCGAEVEEAIASPGGAKNGQVHHAPLAAQPAAG